MKKRSQTSSKLSWLCDGCVPDKFLESLNEIKLFLVKEKQRYPSEKICDAFSILYCSSLTCVPTWRTKMWTCKVLGSKFSCSLPSKHLKRSSKYTNLTWTVAHYSIFLNKASKYSKYAWGSWEARFECFLTYYYHSRRKVFLKISGLQASQGNSKFWSILILYNWKCSNRMI